MNSALPGDPGTTQPLRVAAIRGLLWLGGDQAARRLIAQVFTVMLARMLLPRDFGVLAMALIFIDAQASLALMGLDAAVVQRHEVDEEYLSTVFWANFAVAFVLFAIAGATSPLLGAFFREPRLASVLLVLSLRFLIAATSTVQLALVVRRMDYRTLGLRSTLAIAVGGVTGVGMAYAGMGVWSLVGQMLAETSVKALLLCRAVGWRPRFRFSWPKFRSSWSFSTQIALSRFCSYLVRNADNLLIGRALGPEALGLYGLGYAIFLAPLSDARMLLNQIVFSAVARVHRESHRLRRSFLAATQYVTLVALPALVGLSLVSSRLVVTLFGPRWLPAAPVISILALAGCLQVVTIAGSSGLQAAGRSDLQGRWSVLSVLVYLPAFGIGLRWGIVGMATAYLTATALLAPVQLWLVTRVMRVTAGDIWAAIRPGVIGCTVMAAGVAAAERELGAAGLPMLIVLVCLITLGAAVYGGIVWAVHRQGLLELLSLVRQALVTMGGPRLSEAGDT